MRESKPFSTLVGKTITRIYGLSEGNDEIRFVCSDGSEYSMQHYQDCCESVRIEDVCGDAADIIGYPVLQAEEATSGENPPGIDPGSQDSFTWTFYRLTTNRGQVVIRWYGESNGYYSESVDFEQTAEPTTPPAPAPVDPAAYHNYLNSLFKQL